jgi:ankyrin repeat protein
MLYVAGAVGNLELISRILEARSVYIDSERHDGYTPIHAAVYKGKLDALTLLLAYGADLNRFFYAEGTGRSITAHCREVQIWLIC